MAKTRWDRWLYFGLRHARHFIRNSRAVRAGTRPGSIFFHRELAALLGRDDEWIRQTANEYRACPAAWRRLSTLRSPRAETDGYARSLDVAEGFAAWALVKHGRPRLVVEIGTQHGVSARLWKESLNRYVPGHELILIDLMDERRFIEDHEARFLKGDGCAHLRQIMATRNVDLLYNDAHPYELITQTVEAGLQKKVGILAFHDISRGPRGSFRVESAKVARAERLRHDGPNYETYGTWERHVMAETFGAALLTEDHLETSTHVIQIFDSLFGFGVALRKERGQVSVEETAKEPARGLVDLQRV